MRAISYLLFFLIVIFLPYSLFSQEQQWSWVNSIHSPGDEISYDIVDEPVTGNIYIVGDWRANLSSVFPSGPVPSTDFSITYGMSDGFVAKFDSNGVFLWAFKLGGNLDDRITSIDLDISGNIYITGFIGTGTCYLSGTSPVTGQSTLNNLAGTDFFVAKYNDKGNFIWLKRSVSNEQISGRSISVNNTSVFVCGNYASPVSFGTISPPPDTVKWNTDLFVIKYDLDGTEKWLAGSSGNQAEAADIDSDDSGLYLLGNFYTPSFKFYNHSGILLYETTNASVNNKYDCIVVSMDNNGTHRWARKIGGTNNDKGIALTQDRNRIYLTGYISGSADFPSFEANPVTASTGEDIFISSMLKSNGNTRWAKSLSCTWGANEYGSEIAVDAAGNIIVTGVYQKNLSFSGTLILTSSGQEDAFFALFRSDGSVKWARSIGSANGNDSGTGGVSANNPEKIYVSGNYSDQTDFDNITLPDDFGNNVFLGVIRVPCVAAAGGSIKSSPYVCTGSEALLALTDYEGNITWQSSAAGSNSWSDIQGEYAPELFITISENTDFRAILASPRCGQDTSETFTLNLIEFQKANAGTDQDLYYKTSTLLNARPPAEGEEGSWSVLSGTGIFKDKNDPATIVSGIGYNENIYVWTVTHGICQPSTDEVVINLRAKLIPSLITPNGDGINDFFIIKEVELLQPATLTVFNRWGTEVFKSDSYQNDWNGLDKQGDALPDDTYFYRLTLGNGFVANKYVVITR